MEKILELLESGSLIGDAFLSTPSASFHEESRLGANNKASIAASENVSKFAGPPKSQISRDESGDGFRIPKGNSPTQI